jgi:hypothetical protein
MIYKLYAGSLPHKLIIENGNSPLPFKLSK